jgi:TPR repeat protein
VGLLYVVGNGTEQNFGEAERWLKKAAEGGHRLAARNLSMLYTGAPGMGGKPELAKRWRAFADGGE